MASLFPPPSLSPLSSQSSWPPAWRLLTGLGAAALPVGGLGPVALGRVQVIDEARRTGLQRGHVVSALVVVDAVVRVGVREVAVLTGAGLGAVRVL